MNAVQNVQKKDAAKLTVSTISYSDWERQFLPNTAESGRWEEAASESDAFAQAFLNRATQALTSKKAPSTSIQKRVARRK